VRTTKLQMLLPGGNPQKKSKGSLERRAASQELQSERTRECVYNMCGALQTQSSCNEQNALMKNSTTQSRSRWGSEL